MRVLLADDHALFRAGIASLLEAWGHEVVGQAGNGDEAVALARELRPDLVLMDLSMPGCDGIEATRRIRELTPDVKVVIVTVSDDDTDLFEAIQKGAEGYLLKDLSDEDFGRTLEAIERGEPTLRADDAARIVDVFVERSSEAQRDDPALTERERDVLRLVAEGATNREIASALGISENTVSFHVKNILAKLRLKNRAQATAYAIRAGIADDDPADPSGAT